MTREWTLARGTEEVHWFAKFTDSTPGFRCGIIVDLINILNNSHQGLIPTTVTMQGTNY